MPTAHHVRVELGGGASLERLRSLLKVPRPAGLRGLLDANAQPVVLEEALITGEGVALGGGQKVTLWPDGRFRFEGHFRATGWPSYRVALTTRVVGADGVVLVLVAQGEVHGTNEPGERESTSVQDGSHPIIRSSWPAFRHARLDHDLQYDVDPFGTAGDLITFLAKATLASAAAGTAGLVVVLAAEAVAALNAPELVLPGTTGLMVAGGVLLVCGPGALVPAVIAGAAAGIITAELIHQRRLTDAEYAFVQRVFGDTLPRERILLTNLIGQSGRAFTMPEPGGAILVNIGDGYQDPINYTGHGAGPTGIRAPGQLLIHELTHAWQITHAAFLPGLICSAIANQVGTLGGDMSVYHYGPAGPRWDAFNLEQQGSIVDEWFAGKTGHSGQQQRDYPPMCQDDTNPYWRYIRDNIRTGIA